MGGDKEASHRVNFQNHSSGDGQGGRSIEVSVSGIRILIQPVLMVCARSASFSAPSS